MPANDQRAPLARRAGGQHLAGVHVRGTRIHQVVVAVEHQRHKPQVRHRGERRRARAHHDPALPVQHRQVARVPRLRALRSSQGGHLARTDDLPQRRLARIHILLVRYHYQRASPIQGHLRSQRRQRCSPVVPRRHLPRGPRNLAGHHRVHEGLAEGVGRPRRQIRLSGLPQLLPGRGGVRLLRLGVTRRDSGAINVGSHTGVAVRQSVDMLASARRCHHFRRDDALDETQRARMPRLGSALEHHGVHEPSREAHAHPHPGLHCVRLLGGHEVVERPVQMRQSEHG